MTSAISVSSGSAITRPSSRGSTSTSIGSTPMALQRIHLLVELHGADLGGEGAAGAAGDDDRGQQHAELAQHADGHQVDHEDVGAELAQLLRAHVRQDHRDQEGDQRHDRNRGDAGVVDMACDRDRPPVAADAAAPRHARRRR